MADKKNKPAFNGGVYPEHPDYPNGMSLRQYYACKAMESFCVFRNKETGRVLGFDEAASYSFQQADAMIKFEENESN